mmetsp:Transcript_22637/g.63117  ORF Transcript_22637/g.63117 Transcript_22637/m.63117 type:complete len:198 (+) Transcript_22637:160-753(+)
MLTGVSVSPSAAALGLPLFAETPLPAAEESQPQGLVFKLAIKKSPGASFGIDVTYSSAATWRRHCLFIARVFDSGLVADWNTNSLENKVCPGDLIFQVNDKRGDTVAMIKEMKVKQEVDVHVVRRPMPPTVVEACSETTASASPSGRDSQCDETLLAELIRLDDDELVSLVTAVLQSRPWLQNAVLGPEEGASVGGA